MSGYLLGIDIGSSSIKVSVVDAQTGEVVSSGSSPSSEMKITARQNGWAEQHPDLWWEHLKRSVEQISAQRTGILAEVKAVGIAYQMHGLVVVDKAGEPLRDSIIWCDSRAVPYGQKAFADLGEQRCLSSLLNSPGNFTAAKLAWVKDQEPELFARIDKIMLPGEYIAFKMTGEAVTTPSGLSEGMLWDTSGQKPAQFLLDYYGVNASLLATVKPTFANHGFIRRPIAAELGLPAETPVSYRAGDQPNNAFSLNVLQPGEAAATAGTSGVVFGVTDKAVYDHLSRVNTFVHVNHQPNAQRYGILLCLNGTGSLNQWLKRLISVDKTIDYATMNDMAATAPPGSEGLHLYPYGNGAERTLENRNTGAMVEGLNFNIHGRGHFMRAAQESIVYALHYGMEIMCEMGMEIKTVKAGRANMFLSPLFRTVFSNVTSAAVRLYNTDGAIGAARGAGVGGGIYASTDEAFGNLECICTSEPEPDLSEQYRELYQNWKQLLELRLRNVPVI